MNDETSYVCDGCGEEIVIPVDVSSGAEQLYTEDCPVCCRPNLIRIVVMEDGDIHASAELEY